MFETIALMNIYPLHYLGKGEFLCLSNKIVLDGVDLTGLSPKGRGIDFNFKLPRLPSDAQKDHEKTQGSIIRNALQRLN